MTKNHSQPEFPPEYRYPRNLLGRRLLKWTVGSVVRLLSRIKVEGHENLPDQGPLIVTANHFHFFDALALILSAPYPLEFLADFEMPNVPSLFKIFPALYKVHDVAQGSANIRAVNASLAILAQDGVLGIFPEGRVHNQTLKPALPGAAYLALRSGAPILPVGIYSTDEWDVVGTLRREKRRVDAVCRFGEVVGPLTCDNPRRPSRQALIDAGDRIMTAIAQQLPVEMRGRFGETGEDA